MDGRIEFDLNESLKTYLENPAYVLTPEAPAELLDCASDPESLSSATINGALNSVVDAIAENPESVTRSYNFDTLQFLLKCVFAVLHTSRSGAGCGCGGPASDRSAVVDYASPLSTLPRQESND